VKEHQVPPQTPPRPLRSPFSFHISFCSMEPAS
jgi:hypothetical protein